jgi:hypothetical protein
VYSDDRVRSVDAMPKDKLQKLAAVKVLLTPEASHGALHPSLHSTCQKRTRMQEMCCCIAAQAVLGS